MAQKQQVIVIGAGIGGLTTGALLARRGYDVTIFEQAFIPGGCASTFKRKGFIFDVGATQVAGLEPDGIHHRIFADLEVEVPPATPCDPGCAVYLPGEKKPISMWRDRHQWEQEYKQQFPGSEPFWQLLDYLFQVSWQFQQRDPILPPRNLWDLGQLMGALRLDTLTTFPFTLMTVGDLLRWLGLGSDRRLKTFLDMQLKLYSQVNADETALLYGATALGLSQAPRGLYHLHGSMQVLSDRLLEALQKWGGKLKLGCKVTKIHCHHHRATSVTIEDVKTGQTWIETGTEIVANIPIQNLINNLDTSSFNFPLKLYQQRINTLVEPWGAFVVYLGVNQTAIPTNCPPHLQFLYDYHQPVGEKNSVFVSVSQPDDGRAPTTQRTITASTFVNPNPWWENTPESYQKLKQEYLESIVTNLASYFQLNPETIIHQEAATPRTFAYYTAREKGFVGGIGQRVSTFGPFGFATRTPIPHLWLVGDSTHPGEGTAGVSYSALTTVRQIVNG